MGLLDDFGPPARARDPLPHRPGRPLGPASIAEGALELFLPRSCCGCGRPACTLCATCLAAFAEGAREVPAPRYAPVPVFAAAGYAGPVTRVLRAFKDRGRHDVRELLGLVLASATARALEELHDSGALDLGERVLLVPVPSSAAAVRQRGADLIAELCRLAAAELAAHGLGLDCAPVLASRKRRDQAGLGARDRRANLHGSLRLRHKHRDTMRGRLVLIADDIATTGASIAEARRACAAGGGRVLAAAVIAHREETGGL